MSARIPAASYKSLIRISVGRGPLNQMDATVDLNYYPRPAESHRQRGSKRFKVLCKLPPTFTFSSATGASSIAIAVTKQILCLPRVVLEDVRGGLRAADTERYPALEFRVESSTARKIEEEKKKKKRDVSSFLVETLGGGRKPNSTFTQNERPYII